MQKVKQQCKLHIVILDFDLQKDNEKFRTPIITCKAMTKILYGNSEKSFLECEKEASRNNFRLFFRAHFFMFVLLISYHMFFLVQFQINLHLWAFQKAEIALGEVARSISTFWKTHSSKLISNWTRNHYDYLYKWINLCDFCLVRFTPEQLGITASSALVWLFVEIMAILFSLYLCNVQAEIKSLDLLAFCGYKYFG